MTTIRKAFSFRLFFLLALVGMISAPPTASAEDTDPALGVARVSVTNGDVSVQRGAGGDWIEAPVNTPLVAGDTVATGPSSRAEVQLDRSIFLRLNENADVYLAALENHRFRVQVTSGLVSFVALHNDEAEVEIETPDVVVRPLKAGTYRILVLENGETEITARQGEAEVSSRQGSERLKKGQTMVVRADPADGSLEFQIAKAASADDWDRWNEQRDDQLQRSTSYHRVSRDIYGIGDLDPYGRWVYVPHYGYSWSPYVATGWAPYRYGNWVWLDYYGWTWVSYEPWGWAPYHYGRWYHHASHGWLWHPGHRHRRHHWQPALVAFFGYGSHSGLNVGVGFGFGHVGWIPLGPRDPYYPWYGRRHGHRNVNINIVNVNIVNVYQNARVRGGITVLDANDFSRGRGRNARSADRIDLRSARMIQGELPVVPEREARGRASRNTRRQTETPLTARQEEFNARRAARRGQQASFGEQPEPAAAQVRRGRTGADNTVSAAATPEKSRFRPWNRSGETKLDRMSNSFTGRSRAESNGVENTPRADVRRWRTFSPTSAKAEPTESSRGTSPRSGRFTERQEERTRSVQPEERRGSTRQEEPSRTTRQRSPSNNAPAARENSRSGRNVSPPRRRPATPAAGPSRPTHRPPAQAQPESNRGSNRAVGRLPAANNRSKATPRRTTKASPKVRAERQQD